MPHSSVRRRRAADGLSGRRRSLATRRASGVPNSPVLWGCRGWSCRRAPEAHRLSDGDLCGEGRRGSLYRAYKQQQPRYFMILSLRIRQTEIRTAASGVQMAVPIHPPIGFRYGHHPTTVVAIAIAITSPSGWRLQQKRSRLSLTS